MGLHKVIDKKKRVYVYFNLHKKCWSVRQDGKIVEHSHCVILKDCRYLVGQAGREKVLREKRKNVHAGVSGYYVERVPGIPDKAKEITYNPYKYKTFVDKKTGRAVKVSDYAVLTCGNGWRDVEGIWS
tara:strand:- start:76 stop:459 length:384 start_codon:yes stop_codon:yes gene_type:complete